MKPALIEDLGTSTLDIVEDTGCCVVENEMWKVVEYRHPSLQIAIYIRNRLPTFPHTTPTSENKFAVSVWLQVLVP